jgi:asparagine synthase (glutamine-hydrolysing)
MCGIAGLWGDVGRADAERLVARMLAAIVHRGPDSGGVSAEDGFAFGTRRLSIIDLAGGDQPIWSGDTAGQGAGIVFNGEIYNYRSLRERLERAGHRFRTRSDTEVVLRLYLEEGLGGIKHLEGMFAFCIFDPNARRLHLVRDRFGKKPLYYGQFGGRLLFSSEIKAIIAILDAKPPLDHQALQHQLTLRYVPGPATCWQGIRKLEPGSTLTLELDSGRIDMRRYWRLDFASEPIDLSRNYVAEFERLFLAAVEKRLLAADVPVGVLLSGGLDSSAVSAAAVALGHRDFHTFSVAFEDEGFSELPYAREAARHIGSQHHEIVINQSQFLDALPEIVHFADEPLADLASVPLLYVSRLARESVKVVLSGEGSDELLAGYDFEQLARLLDHMRLVDRIPMSRLLARGMAHVAPGRWRHILSAYARGGWSGYARERGMHMTRVWSDDEKSSLWRSPEPQRTDALVRSWYDEAKSVHPLDQIQQVYCHSWLVEDLLMKADKMSMAASVELRVPFLDHHLGEWAAKLPIEWKVGNRATGYTSKRILRAFAAKHVPASILNRPKQGFPVPAYEWLKGPLGGWAEQRLLATDAPIAALCHRQPIRQALGDARGGNLHAAHQVWGLVVLDQWLRVWT